LFASPPARLGPQTSIRLLLSAVVGHPTYCGIETTTTPYLASLSNLLPTAYLPLLSQLPHISLPDNPATKSGRLHPSPPSISPFFAMAERILMNEYKTLSKEPWTHIELVNDNILHWRVALIVLNPDSLYHGGYFVANMKFPENYPFSPPGR
jgi:hypothetical protein